MADDQHVSSLVTVANAGDRRKTLEELRQVLAVAVVTAETPNQASLAKQLREVLAELDSLPDGKEVTKSDDLAARRATRLSSPVPASAGKPKQRRSGGD